MDLKDALIANLRERCDRQTPFSINLCNMVLMEGTARELAKEIAGSLKEVFEAELSHNEANRIPASELRDRCGHRSQLHRVK